MEESDAPPVCDKCNNAIWTIKHIVAECPAYDSIRMRVGMK